MPGLFAFVAAKQFVLIQLSDQPPADLILMALYKNPVPRAQIVSHLPRKIKTLPSISGDRNESDRSEFL